MLIHILVSCFILQVCRIPISIAQSSTDTKNLLTQLFTTNGYNKYVRPSADLTQALVLDLDLVIVGINELDELGQKLVTTGYLYISWTDIHLTWTPASYNGLSTFTISQKEVWRPDITLKNGFNKFQELGNDFIQVEVNNDGLVDWLPFEVFETKCSINIKYFPFDQQTCDIIFVVWMGSSSDIMVTLYEKGISLEDLDEDGMWTIVSTSAVEDVMGIESRVKFTIKLRRNPTYYIYNIILPLIFLSVLNLFAFALPADSGEKMGYSMTVFLSFAVFITILSSELPKTPGAILSYYMMFELAIGTIIVCLNALELRLHHRKGPVPTKVQKIMKYKCGCRKKPTSVDPKLQKVYPIEQESESDEEKTWDDVVSFIDFYMFWFLTITTIIVTIIFMLLLALNG